MLVPGPVLGKNTFTKLELEEQEPLTRKRIIFDLLESTIVTLGF